MGSSPLQEIQAKLIVLSYKILIHAESMRYGRMSGVYPSHLRTQRDFAFLRKAASPRDIENGPFFCEGPFEGLGVDSGG